MSNNYFQFKQFKVEQDNCAMKVSTDACIQGAWTPVLPEVKNILDIGAGTGLLSLMLAQRNKTAIIDAIEMDPLAASQAKQNFKHSAWSGRLHIIEADARNYLFGKKYDLIICNPPFFINSLLGNQQERNQARHNLSLSFEDLFKVIKSNLSHYGYASILLPVAEHEIWKKLLAKNSWKIFHELNVVPRIHQKANRVISLCSSDFFKQEMIENLIIRNANDCYTSQFIHLLQPFYLKL